MYTTVIFALFMFCIVIQLAFVLYFFINIFSLFRKSEAYTPVQPVSVVICAHNEADNLQRNLPAILAQRYTNATGNPLFEVIVVNDRSDDDTAGVLRTIQLQYKNLVVVDIETGEERKYPGKKNALSKAVSEAKYDNLLMTDADCMPASGDWLLRMVQPLHKGKEIVAGYGKYHTAQGMLNSFIRWETVHTFLQLSTYAKMGKPYMAVGRNLACTKKIFLEAQASPQWSKLPSGDDDLLVRAAGSRENMAIVADSASFTTTTAKENWGAWIKQKQRHLSTGKYYRLAIKSLLSVYATSHALIWICCVALLFTHFWGEALIIMVLRSVIYWSLWQRVACRLNEKKLIRFFPLFDFGWLVYNFAFSPYIIWKNKQQWT